MSKIVVPVLLSFLVVVGLGYWGYLQVSLPPSHVTSGKIIILTNETADQVLSKLFAVGLVRSRVVAKVYLWFTKLDRQIKPGSYDFDVKGNLLQTFETLTQGPRDIWVTIPEGWRREQIAARLGKPDFVAKTATLEGKLFPDTYLLPTYITTEEIIHIMTDNFQKKVGQIDMNTLILASLIEREVKFDKDRPIVAGILLKRLQKDWPLQVDATIQYAKGDWKPLADTKYPSLYNTYMHLGLPPGPICNPGLSAIEAARYPQESPYWFYLNSPDGTTYFAKTLEEHNLHVDKYLKF